MLIVMMSRESILNSTQSKFVICYAVHFLHYYLVVWYSLSAEVIVNSETELQAQYPVQNHQVFGDSVFSSN